MGPLSPALPGISLRVGLGRRPPHRLCHLSTHLPGKTHASQWRPPKPKNVPALDSARRPHVQGCAGHGRMVPPGSLNPSPEVTPRRPGPSAAGPMAQQRSHFQQVSFCSESHSTIPDLKQQPLCKRKKTTSVLRERVCEVLPRGGRSVDGPGWGGCVPSCVSAFSGGLISVEATLWAPGAGPAMPHTHCPARPRPPRRVCPGGAPEAELLEGACPRALSTSHRLPVPSSPSVGPTGDGGGAIAALRAPVSPQPRSTL